MSTIFYFAALHYRAPDAGPAVSHPALPYTLSCPCPCPALAICVSLLSALPVPPHVSPLRRLRLLLALSSSLPPCTALLCCHVRSPLLCLCSVMRDLPPFPPPPPSPIRLLAFIRCCCSVLSFRTARASHCDCSTRLPPCTALLSCHVRSPPALLSLYALLSSLPCCVTLPFARPLHYNTFVTPLPLGVSWCRLLL